MKNVKIIAEIGQAHEGSLGIAHSFIDALKTTKVDAIKFQTHLAEAESSIYEPFRINFSYQDQSRYDYWKRMEFNIDEWSGLKKHCEDLEMEFISSPFSIAAVELLEKIGVKRYKVGSGEVTNFLLLKKICMTKKPIILSSGLSDLSELDSSIEFIKSYNSDLSILQCTTAYPTKAGEWGLKSIPFLKQRYNLPVGYSDHSGKTYPSIAAIALGAEILEFHVTFDRRMFGPDSKASLTINEISNLVEAVRELESDFLNHEGKLIIDNVGQLKNIFEKSLAINRDMNAEQIITFNDLEAKKPKGYGIDARIFEEVIGRKLKYSMKKGSFLKEEDLL